MNRQEELDALQRLADAKLQDVFLAERRLHEAEAGLKAYRERIKKLRDAE